MDELIARLRAVSETGCDPDLPHEAADAIAALVRRADDAEQLATARGHTINGLRNELQAARLERDDIEAELELERMRLAACGVVALSDTPESAATSRAMNDEYRSASCDDVARRVDECMALRAERDALADRLEVDPEYGRPDGIDCRDATIALQDARIADLEAQLKELEGQEPVAWVDVKDSYEGPYSFEGMKLLAIGKHHLFARPLPADPVNAQLLDIATGKLSHLYAGLCPDSASGTRSRDPECPACRAIAAAEAQQAEPVRLTEDELEGFVRWYGERPDIFFSRREYAQTIQEEVLRANGYKVEG